VQPLSRLTGIGEEGALPLVTVALVRNPAREVAIGDAARPSCDASAIVPGVALDGSVQAVTIRSGLYASHVSKAPRNPRILSRAQEHREVTWQGGVLAALAPRAGAAGILDELPDSGAPPARRLSVVPGDTHRTQGH
jgi:hypothetical protein